VVTQTPDSFVLTVVYELTGVTTTVLVVLTLNAAPKRARACNYTAA